MLLKPKMIKFGSTQEEFDQQVTDFLLGNGFPDTKEYRAAFASMVQHMPEDQDSYDPKLMVRKIRKAKTNEHAFYTIYPDKRAPKETAGEGQPKETSADVVQETQG